MKHLIIISIICIFIGYISDTKKATNVCVRVETKINQARIGEMVEPEKYRMFYNNKRK